MRFCSRCATDKVESCFSDSHAWCRDCQRNYSKKYQQENREKLNEYQREYQRVNGKERRQNKTIAKALAEELEADAAIEFRISTKRLQIIREWLQEIGYYP